MVTLQSLPGIILLAGAALAAACGGAATPEPGVLPGARSGAPEKTPRFTFRVVASYPHDPGAFTQGLAYHAGRLYESTGLYGRSSLRLVDPATGEVLRIRRLDSRHFGEGIALYEDTIIQLTWTSNLGFVYDRDSFEPRGEFAYGTEGWGIACDGRRLAMSDGSATLYFRDPRTLEETGRIEVRFADQTLVTQAINGDPCEMEFAYVLPSGESFTFTVHAVYLPRPRIEISGPQGVQATFDWQAARDSVVGRMCTATLVNDVETY